MIPNKNGYQTYQRNKYETASPHRLILMLYEGALRYCTQAIKALEEKDVITANSSLQKVQDIVYELLSCLNHKEGGAIAENLNNLYLYIIDLLIKANVNKDEQFVEEARGLLQEIKTAWEQIGKEVSISNG